MINSININNIGLIYVNANMLKNHFLILLILPMLKTNYFHKFLSKLKIFIKI